MTTKTFRPLEEFQTHQRSAYRDDLGPDIELENPEEFGKSIKLIKWCGSLVGVYELYTDIDHPGVFFIDY